MDKKKFIDMVSTLQKVSDDYVALSNLNVDLLEFTDPYHKVIATLMEDIWGEKGRTIINDFLYEQDFGRSEYSNTTVSQLYEMLNNERTSLDPSKYSDESKNKTLIKIGELFREIIGAHEPKEAIVFYSRWAEIYSQLLKDMDNAFLIGATMERTKLISQINKITL